MQRWSVHSKEENKSSFRAYPPLPSTKPYMIEAEGSLLVGYMAWDNTAPGPNSAVSVHVQLPVMLVRAVHAQNQAVATYLEAGDHVGEC